MLSRLLRRIAYALRNRADAKQRATSRSVLAHGWHALADHWTALAHDAAAQHPETISERHRQRCRIYECDARADACRARAGGDDTHAADMEREAARWAQAAQDVKETTDA